MNAHEDVLLHKQSFGFYLIVVQGGVVAEGADGGQLNQAIILATVCPGTSLCPNVKGENCRQIRQDSFK